MQPTLSFVQGRLKVKMLNDIAVRVYTSELRGVICHWITQCYLPPDTGEPVLD